MKLQTLINFFQSVKLPKEIQLTAHEKIVDVPLFISSHISALKNNSGNKKFMPYYERLIKLKTILESKNKT